MPTYVYKFVETGETIEVQQGFHDENLTEYVHPDTGETMPVKKVFTPVGVTFKGDGFFKTDNRGSKTAAKKDESSSSGGDSSSSSSNASSASSSSESSSSSSSSDTAGASKAGSD